uniref:Uncharacterized protein n=1 Tax=viral metagenome TaxID=1070528 RepID=A0A6M3XYZ6_9ZZZZ
MEFGCAVCDKEPEIGERFFIVRSMIKTRNGVRQGVSVIVCAGHIAKELHRATRIDEQAFVQEYLVATKGEAR